MARHYKIQIDDIWLTDNADENGKRCKVEVEGIAGLLQPNLGTVAVGNNGVPFREIVPTEIASPRGGRAFAFTMPVVLKEVYDDLKALLDDKAAEGESFSVRGYGATGDFDVLAIVNDDPFYIEAKGFSDDRIKSVRISLITTSVVSP